MFLKIMLDSTGEFIFRDEDICFDNAMYVPSKFLQEEYPYIVRDCEDISLRGAIIDIISYFNDRGMSSIVVDLEKLNKELKFDLTPAKEMTVAEIEEILGHKVKIVD